MFAATLLLGLAQSDESALREAEKRRIAGKVPLTETERARYERVRGKAPSNSVKGLSVAVLPVSFRDAVAEEPATLFLSDLPAYFAEASGKAFALVPKMYGGIKLECDREEFGRNPVRSDRERELLGTVVRAWLARDGEGLLAAYGGVAFVPAGRIGAKESALWPHQGSLEIGTSSIPYIVVPCDSGPHAVGIAAHESGHLLGLQDKYEVGKHCLMGTGYSYGKASRLCGCCRSALGWAPTSIAEARSERKIAIPCGEILRIPMTSDGSESIVIDVRKGDLEVWRVVAGKTPEWLGNYPTRSSDRLTPFSDPPLVGKTVGARELWLTDLRVEDGVGYLTIERSAALTPLEEFRKRRIGRPLGK